MECKIVLDYNQLSALLQMCDSAIELHRAEALANNVHLDAIENIFYADVFDRLHTNILIKSKKDEAKHKHTMKLTLSNAECMAIIHGKFYTYNNEYFGKLKDYLYTQIQVASWQSTALYASQIEVGNLKLMQKND